MQYSTNIRKKDGGWQYIITYKENGKWKTKSKQGFPIGREGKKLCQQAMDECLSALKNQITSSEALLDNEIIFKEFSKLFVEHISLYREFNTVIAIEGSLNAFSSLNEKKLSSITKLDVQKCVDLFVKRGLKPITISNYLNKLNSLFLSAMNDYNLIKSLPTKNIKYNNDKSDSTKRALSVEEASNILSWAKNYKKNSQYYYLCLIAVKCGLRLGEILGLTWEDIDFKNKVIRINKQWKQLKNGSYGFGDVKNKNANRDVPMPKLVILELQTLSNVANMDNNDNIIKLKKLSINNSRLFSFINTDSTSITLNRLFKINKFDITIHELRHTYATNLISNGIDFKTAAKLLGHSVEQTMKTYSHVNDDMMKRATDIIENIL